MGGVLDKDGLVPIAFVSAKPTTKPSLPKVVPPSVPPTVPPGLPPSVPIISQSASTTFDMNTATECFKSRTWTLKKLEEEVTRLRIQRKGRVNKEPLCQMIINHLIDNKIPFGNPKKLHDVSEKKQIGGGKMDPIVADLIDNPVEDPWLEIQMRLLTTGQGDRHRAKQLYQEYLTNLD